MALSSQALSAGFQRCSGISKSDRCSTSNFSRVARRRGGGVPPFGIMSCTFSARHSWRKHGGVSIIQLMLSGVSTDISDLMSGLAFGRFSAIRQHRLALRKDFVRTLTPTPCPQNSRTKSPQSVRKGRLVFSAVVIDFDVTYVLRLECR